MTTTLPKSTSYKIHRRIVLTFLLTTAFSILLVGTTLRYVLEKTTLDNWKKRQEFVTLEFAPQCNHEIQAAKKDLEFVSRIPVFSNLSHIDQIDPSIRGVPENVEVEKREIFRNLKALGERFASLFLLTPEGNLYLVHPFKNQVKVNRLNFADRAYFKEAIRTKKPVISDSFISGAGNPVVAIAVPALDKAGDITAIIGGGVYLTNLSKLVDKKRIGNFDLGFIVDSSGNLIAHTNTKLLKSEIRNRYIEHALVSKFLDKSPQDDSEVMIKDCVDPVDGKHYLTSFVRLKSGWGLGLALSRETILSEIRPVVWRITILVSFLILIVGATGVFFAQWIGRRWIGTEKSLIKQTHDLGERIKELNGLYNISRVIEKPGISLEEILQEIVVMVPHSYQHSEITCSRIVMKDKQYKTKNFKETEWKQSSEFFVTDSQTGTLEVFYLEEKPEIHEGPFLKEERIFIDEIADRLRMIIARKQVGQALRKSEKNLKIRNRIADILLTIPDDKMYGEILGMVMEVMKSKYGVFGYIDENGALVCPSMTKNIWDQCQIPDKDIVFPRDTWGGIWGMALTEKTALYSNKSFKVPEGHVPVMRALDVPIIFKGEVIGNLLVGNKETNYVEGDQELLEEISRYIAPVLSAKLQRDREEKDRKRAEKALAIREKAISSSINGIALSDIEGNLTFTNESFQKMWGYDDTEVLGKPFANFWLREKETVKAMKTLMVDGIWTGKLIARRKDGSHFDGQVLARLVTDDTGKNISVVNSVIDITKEKILQNELIRSERLAASGGLAASIAHEINSPLQGITSIISFIERAHKQDEGLVENLNLLKGGFANIRDIVKRLLDLNRPGKEKKQPININNIIEDTVSLLKSHLKTNRMNVNLSLSTKVPGITASPQQLGQMFLNLINNSVEAMADVSSGKEIKIKSNLRGKNIVIKVADTGPGIPKREVKHVFDPFYTRKKKMGMGVGLSICQGIVEDHNGSITVNNSPKGGAVFTITLPAEQADNHF
jgi:PAS domain S-box-containing protein